MNLEKHWSQYVSAVGPPMPISSNSEAYPTSSSKIGVSGFLDLKPSRPEIQAKYDAMQPTWEGIQPTNTAIFQHDMFRQEYVHVKSQK